MSSYFIFITFTYMPYIFKPSKKQHLAFQYLEDKTTRTVLYGGAAGGGKTFLGCAWQIFRRLDYPGTRGLIGRAKLKTLKETTLKTLFNVLNLFDMKSGFDFNYNAISGVIKFQNESEILLKDLFLYPSDPNFDSLGSLEITDAFIDEVSEVTERGVSIVGSRIRYKLSEYNLAPKTLLGCNPSKSWLYTKFYKPSIEGTLPSHYKFIQAFVDDNPDKDFVKIYKKTLSDLSPLDVERLLYGNWEYDDDKAKLFNYDSIIDMFSNEFVQNGKMYITADIARKGSDKGVIIVWSGYRVVELEVLDFSLTTFTESRIHELAMKYDIPRSKIVVDEDGVGGGVVDHLKCKGFINNSKALKEKGKDTNYSNLKSQCYFKLAEFVNRGEIYIADARYKNQIIEELEVVKRKDIDKDGRLSVEGKDKIKEVLGRSPDFADALMMRMYFELKKTGILASS